MEKLIELLNEFNWKESFWLDTDSISWEKYINRWDWNQCFIYEHIISKKFWFIKWLVENDKIDRTFRENVKYPYYLEKWWLLQGYEKSDVIIMLLSISDTPIDDLISYLKWEITAIEDWPITYRKDSNWKLVADREPPIVLC